MQKCAQQHQSRRSCQPGAVVLSGGGKLAGALVAVDGVARDARRPTTIRCVRNRISRQ